MCDLFHINLKNALFYALQKRNIFFRIFGNSFYVNIQVAQVAQTQCTERTPRFRHF